MLTSRPAVLSDATWLLALRNDAETVRWSISGVAVTPEEHAEWFARIITDPARALMVVENEPSVVIPSRYDRRVATYRLDRIDSDQIEVALTVAPPHRGMGLASQVIARAAQHAMRCGAESVIALVKRENRRSLRAFLRAGFWLSPPSTDNGDLLLLGATPEDIASGVCSLCADLIPHHTNAAGSVGGDEGRAPRYDLHVGVGGGLIECEVGDMWIAYEGARKRRYSDAAASAEIRTRCASAEAAESTRASGLSAGPTPAASTIDPIEPPL